MRLVYMCREERDHGGVMRCSNSCLSGMLNHTDLDLLALTLAFYSKTLLFFRGKVFYVVPV